MATADSSFTFNQADSVLPIPACRPAGQSDQPLARILISDDSPDIQNIYALLLPQYGFEVLATPQGQGPLTVELCRKYLPDLVISDVNKPDCNGYDVCYAIRSDPHTAHIPLLFVTAMDAPPDRQRGRAVGADDYIVKPFLFEGLLYRVAMLLTHSCQVREHLLPPILNVPGIAWHHPVTGLPGPQAFSRMLPGLTREDGWAALTLTITGFEPLLRIYNRTFADILLVGLVTLLRKFLTQWDRTAPVIAHPSYGWHITVLGSVEQLRGLYAAVRAAFRSEVRRWLHPADFYRGYLVYTDFDNRRQQVPLPDLLGQWIEGVSGALPNVRSLWDRLDHTPFLA